MPNAIITGASRGIGYALAERLADAGWNLIIDGRDATALHAAADRLRVRGSEACRTAPSGSGDRIVVEPIVGDITDPAHRAALIRAASARGRLDLLINNAGTLGPSPLPPVAGLDAAALREIVEVNVVAPLALTQAALPLLRAAHGVVADLTSDAAAEAYPGWGGYGASKAATEQLRAVLAAEEPDVIVWRIDPGDVRTDMHQAAYPGEDISDRPLPAEVTPGLLGLLATRPPSGRYHLADYGVTGPLADERVPDPGPRALWLTIDVADFDRAQAFYRDAIGLTEIDGWSIEDERGAVFAVGTAGRIEIEQPGAPSGPVGAVPAADGSQGRAAGGSRARAAIEYPDVPALTAAHARLADHPDVTPTPVLRHHRGHSGFTVHDPSGTELYLWSEK